MTVEHLAVERVWFDGRWWRRVVIRDEDQPRTKVSDRELAMVERDLGESAER